MSGALFSGAAVQRVDLGPEVAVLRLRAPGETCFAVVASGRHGGAGLCSTKPWKGLGLPGGCVPEGEKARVRTRLEGARLEAIGARSVTLRKGEARFVVEAGAGEGGRVTLREIPAGEPLAEDAARPEDEETWRRRGARIVEALGEAAFAARRQELARALAKARARVERRIVAVRGDLSRIGEASRLAARAALFVVEAARAPRGATKLSAPDWSSGEPVQVELALDPARPAREQLEAMFKRARRLTAGAAVARPRLAEAEGILAKLQAIGARIEDAATASEVEALTVEARAAAPRDFAMAPSGSAGQGRGGEREKRGAAAGPCRVFTSGGGARILVGKGAAHNDALTFHLARPHDLWLHAKGRAGAHVVVPLDKGKTCPSELLVDAAHLAAHFSESREEGVVEVEHTERRHLRKPRGSAPGFVVIDREKVLVLRVEKERLARLLAAEALAPRL